MSACGHGATVAMTQESHSLPRYYCLPPAGVLHSQNKVIKCAAYGVAQGRGQRYGFININDMYNNDVGKGGAQGCEAYEVK